MYSLNGRLKAFTLIELILVLLLTTLLIGIAGISYVIVVKEMDQFKQKAEKTYFLHRAAAMLTEDFQKPGLIMVSASGISIHLTDGSTIGYQFYAEKIVRQANGTTEEILVGISEYKLSYGDEPGGHNNYINNALVTLIYNKEYYSLHLRKDYNAAELFEMETT